MIGLVAGVIAILSLLLAQPLRPLGDTVTANEARKADTAFRNLAGSCVGLGFTPIDPGNPTAVQKLMFAHFLLMTPREARLVYSRWVANANAVDSLGDPDRTRRVAEQAGDALAAVSLDPSRYDEAKAKYKQAMRDGLRDVTDACAAIAADPFLGKHYLTGSVSVESMIEASWAKAYAETVKDGR